MNDTAQRDADDARWADQWERCTDSELRETVRLAALFTQLFGSIAGRLRGATRGMLSKHGRAELLAAAGELTQLETAVLAEFQTMGRRAQHEINQRAGTHGQ